jgi:hypothetical protein
MGGEHRIGAGFSQLCSLPEKIRASLARGKGTRLLPLEMLFAGCSRFCGHI